LLPWTLLSFLVRAEWQLKDDDVIKAALHFANEVAGFCGSGLGARHFPLSAQDDFVRARHWDSIKRRNAIFVSHSSADAVLVSALQKRLNNEPGVKTWVNDARPSEIVWDAVDAGIKACNIFIVFVTSKSVSSIWVPREVARARDLKKTIVPVIVTSRDSVKSLWAIAAPQFSLNTDFVYVDASADVDRGSFPSDELMSRWRRAWSTEF
jgi:TIR domain